MFEQYDQEARNVIFFAGFEARQFGDPKIGSHHLLLALLREGKFFEALFNLKEEVIRTKILELHPINPTAQDDPNFADECHAILRHTGEEAERQHNRQIGQRHLFVALLLEEHCDAAKILMGCGLNVELVRKRLFRRK